MFPSIKQSTKEFITSLLNVFYWDLHCCRNIVKGSEIGGLVPLEQWAGKR